MSTTLRRHALGLTNPPPPNRNRRKHFECLCWVCFVSGWGLCAGVIAAIVWIVRLS